MRQRETCGACGASIEVSADSFADEIPARAAIREWRRLHLHQSAIYRASPAECPECRSETEVTGL